MVKKVEDNFEGQCITISIQLKYEDLKVFEYPPNCYKCPLGFSGKDIDCGKNRPPKEEDLKVRPSTCKLIKVDFKDYL